MDDHAIETKGVNITEKKERCRLNIMPRVGENEYNPTTVTPFCTLYCGLMHREGLMTGKSQPNELKTELGYHTGDMTQAYPLWQYQPHPTVAKTRCEQQMNSAETAMNATRLWIVLQNSN